MEVEIFPVKQESVIISTAAARNKLNDNNNEENYKIKIEPVEFKDEDDEEVHIKIEPSELEVEETVADIKSEELASLHFLTNDENTVEPYEKKKHDFLEYLPKPDGSVVCKRCGEVLPTRTHWYRHKYKFHVHGTFLTPAPLFKCARCNVFFKSRKGYMGHVSSRHSGKEKPKEHTDLQNQIKEAPLATVTVDKKKPETPVDWREQRIQEEKLVADIINRVKKECEAQGGIVSRKGYTRRTTVMNVDID